LKVNAPEEKKNTEKKTAKKKRSTKPHTSSKSICNSPRREPIAEIGERAQTKGNPRKGGVKRGLVGLFQPNLEGEDRNIPYTTQTQKRKKKTRNGRSLQFLSK